MRLFRPLHNDVPSIALALEFRAFVSTADYKRVAERPIDWEELKKHGPPGAPKPADEMLQPGSLVFIPPPQAVPLRA